MKNTPIASARHHGGDHEPEVLGAPAEELLGLGGMAVPRVARVRVCGGFRRRALLLEPDGTVHHGLGEQQREQSRGQPRDPAGREAAAEKGQQGIGSWLCGDGHDERPPIGQWQGAPNR